MSKQHWSVVGSLALIASVLAACSKPEPTRVEVISEYRASVEPTLEAVRTAQKTISSARTATGRYKLLSAPVFLHYANQYEPLDPNANAVWAYEADLANFSTSDEPNEKLRIPYSDVLTTCAQALSGGASDHPTYLRALLADCARAKYLFAIRIVEASAPSMNIDGKTFVPGFLDTIVFVVDLANPTELAGSFPVRVESDRTAHRQHDDRGPEGALMSSFASAVESAAKTRREPLALASVNRRRVTR